MKLIYYSKIADSDGVIKIKIIKFVYILVFSLFIFILNESVIVIKNVIWNNKLFFKINSEFYQFYISGIFLAEHFDWF